MERIIELIDLGQRKLALKMLIDNGYDMVDLFEELGNLAMDREIIIMFKIAESTGYISFNPANLRNIK